MSIKKDSWEVAADDFCPCESGAVYGKCCKKKKFKWTTDKRGRIYKTIQMAPETREVFKHALQRFKEIFGRKPGGNDRIFPDAYLITSVDYNRNVGQAMHAANIRPELIYASQKTGRLVTDVNVKLLTNAELKEWNDAIDEYFEKFGSGTLQSPQDKHALALVAQIDHVIIAMAIFIDKELDSWSRSKTPASATEFFVHFCFAKAIAAIRAVKCLIESDIGNECLPLARSLHDTYLHCVFARISPSERGELAFALAGTKIGTHEFLPTKKGRDPRILVEAKSGKQIPVRTSRYVAAQSPHPEDIELYDTLYAFLSEYTHPNLASFSSYSGSDYEIHSHANLINAVVYTLFFSVLILDEASKSPRVRGRLKRDVKYVRDATKSLVLATFQHFSFEPEISNAIKSRLS